MWGLGPGEAIKLKKGRRPPIRAGNEVLSRFRRRLAPNLRVRAFLESAVMATRVGLEACARKQALSTEVVRDLAAESSGEPPSYQVRTAALLERVRAREAGRRPPRGGGVVEPPS